MTGKVPEWARQDMRKSAGYGCKPGVKQMGSPFHGAKTNQAKGEIEVEFYADGGEVETLKQEGLKASEGEKVGFFDRLRAGNIDDPSSEAYKRFGAGRGQLERDFKAAEKQMDDLDAMKKADAAKPAPKVEAPSRDMDAPEQTTKPTSNTFGSAFAAARKAGQSTFTWNGKSYTTATKNSARAGGDADAQTGGFYGRTEDGEQKTKTRNLGGNRMGRAAARKRESAK